MTERRIDRNTVSFKETEFINDQWLTLYPCHQTDCAARQEWKVNAADPLVYAVDSDRTGVWVCHFRPICIVCEHFVKFDMYRRKNEKAKETTENE